MKPKRRVLESLRDSGLAGSLHGLGELSAEPTEHAASVKKAKLRIGGCASLFVE